ncbi:hypothetical protein NZK35_02530 [Stieleria sp. ICT_E10.1]|uniref:hypothetical protein n=1 Tax=Stieleria sedimenti TaxID=2976331 RepID=UPI00217F416E|nr:hypothetical protein [Stieleria sedimenti]MCS7465545.1 hypothetical protein [Stieleria sedimenti]
MGWRATIGLNVLLCLLGASSAQAEPLDADEIRRQGWAVRPYVYGKELVYKIDARTIDSPDGRTFYSGYPDVVQRGTRTLTLGRPSTGRSYIPSRLMHFQKNAGEPHTDEDPLLTFFQGFDGRKTSTYVRKLLHDYEIKQHVNSSGTEQVGCAVGAFAADPMVRLLINRQEPFQGLPMKQYDFVELKDQVRAERVEHPADANAIRISSTDPNVESYTIVSSAPEYLPLERRISYPDGPFAIQVSELKTFDGHRYPSRATYRELKHDGTFGWEASIELISVENIDADQFEWIPPWPAGTEWKRERDVKRFEVPYTREQLRKIQAAGLARARSHTSEGSSSYFYLNIALIGVIIALALYRLWPRSNEPV